MHMVRAASASGVPVSPANGSTEDPCSSGGIGWGGVWQTKLQNNLESER